MPAYARANAGSLRRRLLEEGERLRERVFAALLEEEAPAQIQIVRLQILGALRRRRAGERDGVAELWRDGETIAFEISSCTLKRSVA